MSGPIGYAAPDGYNEIRVSPKNPLPVAVFDEDPNAPQGGLTRTEASLAAIAELIQQQNGLLAAVLVTLGNLGSGFVQPGEANDLVGDFPLN